MTTPRKIDGRRAVCRYCQQPIVFATTLAGANGRGGKPMPLDPTPHPDGNVAVRRTSPGHIVARVLGKDDTLDTTIEVRAMPHFATCVPILPTDEPAPANVTNLNTYRRTHRTTGSRR